jgi:ribosome-associated protein
MKIDPVRHIVSNGKEIVFLNERIHAIPITKVCPSHTEKKEPLSRKQIPAAGQKSKTRLNRNSKIFKTIIRAVQEKKGEQIVSLDLRNIPEAVADFFIICQASNPNQLKAIADFITFEVKQTCLELPYKHEGRQAEQWILIDYVNIVVHIMLPEPRAFYQLEELWSDATIMEHPDTHPTLKTKTT